MKGRMTKAQAAWLLALHESPRPLPRPRHSTVGFNCMRRGWTQWAPNSNWLEVLTPEGIAALQVAANEVRDA